MGKMITWHGESHTLGEWGKILDISPLTINSRLDKGWTVDRALSVRPKKKKSNILWMAVNPDKYQLPVAVADSAEELARMCGTTPWNIHSYMQKQKVGRVKEKYFKVMIDEEDD